MKEDKYKYLPKFYDLETLTQEDLNKLALERNTLVKENQRLNIIINKAIQQLDNLKFILFYKKLLCKCLTDIQDILIGEDELKKHSKKGINFFKKYFNKK